MDRPRPSIRRVNRRDFLRIGGLGLCGVSMLDILRAQAEPALRPRAKQLIVCWLSGGPPHTDMFDMKPELPEEYRGDFKPIQTNVNGLQICELMPELARQADKYTVIRSISTLNSPGDHEGGPCYWLRGNPSRLNGGDKHPIYGSVVSKYRPGRQDLPNFVTLGEVDRSTQNALASSFLGPAHNPIIFDPVDAKDQIGRMLTPQLELPALEGNFALLKALDGGLRRLEQSDRLIEGMDKYQQMAFNLLRSPKLREALDLTREDPRRLARYTRYQPAKTVRYGEQFYRRGNPLHFLLARRLIEAGVPVVHFSVGYWDWHQANFHECRAAIPMFDVALATLLEDLHERGLLESTIVVALGEMGRTPKITKGQFPGRDHWDYAQFVLAAGGGFRKGTIVGATDKRGERVVDKFYKVESFATTLYHLLGIDPETTAYTPANRPVKLVVEQSPVIKEAIL